MSRRLPWVLAAALAAVFVWRKAPVPPDATPARARDSRGPAAPHEPPAVPFPSVVPAATAALPGADPVRPATEGDLRISGTQAGTDALKDLHLTDSQHTTVQALLAHRNQLLEQLRRGLEEEARESGKVSTGDASSRAKQIQGEFLESIRSALLPEQWGEAEALIRRGRWGGYAIPIPSAAGADP